MASEERVRATTDAVLGHRFHRDCGLQLRARRNDGARCAFRVNEFTANPFGVLHGGILYAMLDVAAFLAVVPALDDGESAVSHDVHVSVLRAASTGESVDMDARILRRGRRLIFTRVEAAAGDGRLIASASVTKSVIAAA